MNATSTTRSSARKILSVEFIDRHDENEIKQNDVKDAGACGWRFHFNSEPSETVKREIVRAITSGRGRDAMGANSRSGSPHPPRCQAKPAPHLSQ